MWRLPSSHLPERKHWKGIHCTNTDSKWQDHWMVLNSQGFPPITAAPATSPSFLPHQGKDSHVARIRHVNTCAVPTTGQECLQVASQCHLSQLCPKNCAPSQLWQALSHLWKPLGSQRPLVWKDLSICPWKWIPMPHKFPGNCPYLFIDLFMSFLPFLKGAGRKRARPGQLWHHASAVKTNLTFSPPGSSYYIP